MDERKIVGILYEQPFSCICCHELKWRRGVQNAIPDSEELSEKVDVDYVMRERKNLFCKLGGYWICTPCKSSPRPKLCAKDRLMCPWDGVPERLLPLNPVSIPCRASKVLTHDFCRLKMRLRLRLYCLPTSENRTGGRCFMERSTLFPSLWPGGDRRGAR